MLKIWGGKRDGWTLFFERHISKITWRLSQLGLNLGVGQKMTFPAWLERWFVDVQDDDRHIQCILIFWNIWKARNQFIWDNSSMAPSNIVAQINFLFAEIKRSISKSIDFQRQIEDGSLNEDCIMQLCNGRKQLHPMSSDINIQIDGAYHSPSGKAAIGMVFYNSQGTSILTKARLVYAVSALQAERLAYLYAMRITAELGFTNISIRTDCKQLIQGIRNNRNVPYDLKLCLLILFMFQISSLVACCIKFQEQRYSKLIS